MSTNAPVNIAEKALTLAVDAIEFLAKHLWGIISYIWVLGWAVVLLPQSLFDSIHVTSLRAIYLPYIGVANFTSSVLLVTFLLHQALKYFCRKVMEHFQTQNRERSLCDLTPVEYIFLKKYVDSQSQTVVADIYDGIPAGLVDKGILYKANSQSNHLGQQDFNLYPWAYKYLMTHQELFQSGEKKNG